MTSLAVVAAARRLSEADFQTQIIDLAERLGWRWMHVEKRLVSRGDSRGTYRETPTKGPLGKGWPDLVLVRDRVQFVHLGLPRRPQGAATAAANSSRGSGLTRRELRIAAGEILDRPRCAGVKTQAPRKGAPCQLRATADSDYCAAHDPARADQRAEALAAMRARRAA